MKKVFTFLLSMGMICLMCPLFSEEMPLSGTLSFADGSQVEFADAVFLNVYINGGPSAGQAEKTIPVCTETGIDSVSLAGLKSFTLLDFEVTNVKTAMGADMIVSRGKVEILDNEGQTTECWYDQLSSIQVEMTDPQSGAAVLREFPLIKKDGSREINIKMIVFHK